METKQKAYNFLNDTDKENIVNSFFNKENLSKNIPELSKECGVSERAYSRILKENGINSRLKRRYSIENEDYFDTIDTNDKAYFLGLIYADGFVGEHDNFVISLKYLEDNNNVLYKLKEEIGFSGELRERRVVSSYNNNKIDHSLILGISNKKIVSDLKKHGVLVRKSYKSTMLPNIEDKFLGSFIRGFFDGDGSICSYYDNYDKRHRWNFSILADELFLNDIQDCFNRLLGIKKVKLKKTSSSEVLDLSHRGVENIIKIREFLYENSTTYIKYKKDKIFEI